MIIINLQEQLGYAIKRLRKAKSISQEKFAMSIEMDRTYFSSVEAGKRNISLKNIEKIAKGLNVTVSELFFLAEKIN
ncbi:helix-turn-helix domain-containing protein [Parvimonas sp. C2]|uniref:helix-turn-helix domain-containing protein n=1 Tax=Parvimonas sp. C2 TaxID=3110692 RepID=UPI002B45BCF4|nr:helix-turn-helix transcriptional regulator [Parvimonas sp. C2]MEB3072884.1 helix-turn-helix transcriptional regulator [Parvimonas sp. C2]